MEPTASDQQLRFLDLGEAACDGSPDASNYNCKLDQPTTRFAMLSSNSACIDSLMVKLASAAGCLKNSCRFDVAFIEATSVLTNSSQKLKGPSANAL